ncbi:ABC transporter permease [Kribbia dieselivorans]|uniref:ABC transporter permease n=1 Tax=Kribbia dieselivorans TaxID=331526 RepID=UPI00083932F7|nr:ABC transporter permease [Kribbia dieselivorans]
MTVNPSWSVAIALAALLATVLIVQQVTRVPLQRSAFVAAIRAIIQLLIAATIITAVIDNLWLSLLLLVFMFGMAVYTTGKRVDALHAWPWTALAIAAGIIPVLVIIIASRTMPLAGVSLIPIGGIIIGNTMTAHTLLGRRAFDALRSEHGQYEASLSLGFTPRQSVQQIVHRRVPEALLPGLDQVRTTGVVTLPGAFIGVMLGGGSPVQAATAQVLVLFGIMAAQNLTIAVAERFIDARRLLPRDLQASLQD